MTEDELRLFSKMEDLGDHKKIDKAEDIADARAPRNINKGSQGQIIKQVKDGSISLTEKGNTIRKSNYGEMKMDQIMAEKGYNRISIDTVTGIGGPIPKGIDGVYYDPDILLGKRSMGCPLLVR